MRKLESIKFQEIVPTETYLYCAEENESNGMVGSGSYSDLDMFIAKGEEIIEKLCKKYCFEEFKENSEADEASLENFLENCWDANGDYELIHVYKF